VFGALKHMALEGRLAALRHALSEAVAAGGAAAPLLAVRWERRWAQPLARVRAQLRVRPAAEWRGYAAN
jgi:ubiquinone biosynthesis protein Coq4